MRLELYVESVNGSYKLNGVDIPTFNKLLAAIADLIHDEDTHAIPLYVVTGAQGDLFVWDEGFGPEWIRGKVLEAMDS